VTSVKVKKKIFKLINLDSIKKKKKIIGHKIIATGLAGG